jgi:hypothetical protein
VRYSAKTPGAQGAVEHRPRPPAPAPGKHTLVEQACAPVVQRRNSDAQGHRGEGAVHAAAAHGVATPSSPLPFASTIQRAFGRHDVSTIETHQGPEAAASAHRMGAQAFATGRHVVLGGSADLHAVAHEAAHVVQQRGGVQLQGGVGEVGDTYERHADAVADAVVAGQSAEALLDQAPGGGHHQAAVQRAPAPSGSQANRPPPAARPRVMHYGDMLAAVLAAKSLSDSAKPDDPAVHAQILALLEPVERRLGELNDHRGRLAQFGAGNIAGQTALDTSEAAIRSWRQLLLLGAMVRTDELVLRFRMAAEVLQFLTGEQRDAPTLREFNHVSGMVGIGVGAAVLTPALVALAAAEAPLLAFAGRLSAQRVALWAAAHPVAALASSEVLLGFGLQIGDGGWASFWGQLADPKGRWFVLAQVLMDYMHVRGSLGGHHGSPTASPRRSAPGGAEVDVEAARDQIAKARIALTQVHDAAASAEPTAPHTPRPGAPAHEMVEASASRMAPDAAPREARAVSSSQQLPRKPFRMKEGTVVDAVEQGRAVVPTGKVEVYLRGKAKPFTPEMAAELRALKQDRQVARKAFDASPEKATRIEQLERLLHNHQRSVEMSNSLTEAGLPNTGSANAEIFQHLLDVGQRVTEKSRIRFRSELAGAQGRVTLLSTWVILPDGRVLLSTLNVIPQ